jgi:hypothetical protein
MGRSVIQTAVSAVCLRAVSGSVDAGLTSTAMRYLIRVADDAAL